MANKNEPAAIDVSPESLKVTWSDQHMSEYPAGYLRAACQCASCVHEITGQPILDKSKIPENISYLKAEPMGNYAVTFQFSDYHATGIYTYEHLREICPCPICNK